MTSDPVGPKKNYFFIIFLLLTNIKKFTETQHLPYNLIEDDLP